MKCRVLSQDVLPTSVIAQRVRTCLEMCVTRARLLLSFRAEFERKELECLRNTLDSIYFLLSIPFLV